MDSMAKFLFVYTGGAMGETPEEQQKAMEAWMNWFGTLGSDIVDGGNPLGPSAVVKPNGSTKDGAPSALTGYSIISAQDLADASSKAKGCPVLSSGGSVEVYEAMPIG
jgi:hypothetical protein